MELLPTNAYLITEKCGVSQVAPKRSREFQLEEIQRYVGGIIKVVRLTDDQIMIVNE